jgi:hypothetical protein
VHAVKDGMPEEGDLVYIIKNGVTYTYVVGRVVPDLIPFTEFKIEGEEEE